ncbi:MAG TPA: class I SAM-dependent methyltransferase [Bacteroidia bacterium]|nr:class I SAM-dependent methyltransferase [Bacteroidia bacterium]
MQLLTPTTFTDYELIDSGDFEKLERFGSFVTIRPEPQALWDKALSVREWDKLAHVRFVAKSSSSGTWKHLREMPDRWNMKYDLRSGESHHRLQFRLALTSFKHVGIFPEQSVNWDYIYKSVLGLKTPQPKVLNLFAYTGGASLAAKAAGADITHLDSIKQVVSWARENMELSGLDNIRWMVEDAMTYVKREVKRGKKYNGIILDPPAYGHGANGEKWKLEDQLNEMMRLVFSLLDETDAFLILNTYSLGLSSLIIDNLFDTSFLKCRYESGEIFLNSTSGQKLPLGVFGRGQVI